MVHGERWWSLPVGEKSSLSHHHHHHHIMVHRLSEAAWVG
uniref:Uncharacterized protein n=1 Tax=Mesocestoides corti TaxID=53468 RepID=A0A5K3G2J5_MESCO